MAMATHRGERVGAPRGMPKMERVESSNVYAIGYDDAVGTLYVQFQGGKSSWTRAIAGAMYRYFDVPRGIYRRFLRVSSKGRFLDRNIKGTYSYSKWTGGTWRGEGALTQDQKRRARTRFKISKMAQVKRRKR